MLFWVIIRQDRGKSGGKIALWIRLSDISTGMLVVFFFFKGVILNKGS